MKSFASWKGTITIKINIDSFILIVWFFSRAENQLYAQQAILEKMFVIPGEGILLDSLPLCIVSQLSLRVRHRLVKLLLLLALQKI